MARILIVEDDRSIRALLEDFLSTEGFDTVFAADGRSAIELAGSARPELILMDMLLPGIDGLTASRMLRADPRTRHIPIVAMSANRRALREAPDAPVDEVIAKPFDLDELLTCLIAHAGVAGGQRRVAAQAA
jgi:two-component system, cell cycle response regulator DivK